MNNLRPYRRMGLDSNFEDFYNLIDSFFNDEFTPQRAVERASFRVDVIEEDDKYEVHAELPGFEKEDIDITLEDGRMVLSAEHSEDVDESDEEKNYVHRERKSTKMERRMFFRDIDEDNIKASLDKGILKIEIPKLHEEDQRKKIEID